jgi:hypothetical protein
MHDGLPGKTVWLIIKRTISEAPAYSFYISNAPISTRLKTFVWWSGVRWAIEQCFEETKTELGLDHYEVRIRQPLHGIHIALLGPCGQPMQLHALDHPVSKLGHGLLLSVLGLLIKPNYYGRLTDHAQDTDKKRQPLTRLPSSYREAV